MGPGTVLDGKYEIVSQIGAGGMGEVFKARHLHLDTMRCIKVMKATLLADPKFRERFVREARMATQVHHQNIAVVHDFFLGDGGSYLVSEFIDGSTVRQWLQAYGAFPVAVAADVTSQVLSGLDHIHRRGLLHRDISADNIMLTYNDDRLLAKIIDLGVAKQLGSLTETTQAGIVVGNPRYMSPEQLGFLDEGETIDGRADLYALGIVLYEMLAGAPPFVSESPQSYIMKHLTERPAAPPNVGAPLAAVVLRALEKDRKLRFSDARAFAAALAPFRTAETGSMSRAEVVQLRRGKERPVAPAESATERDWKRAVSRDTFAAYRDYLGKHPDSEQSTQAKARLFEIALLDDVRAKEAAHDKATLKRLAVAHPPSTPVGKAVREALERLKTAQEKDHLSEPHDFDAAWESGTTAAWDHYLRQHGVSPRAGEAALHRQEASDFEAAQQVNTVNMWKAFLKSWPEGRHRLDATVRLRALR